MLSIKKPLSSLAYDRKDDENSPALVPRLIEMLLP
jgi:hypothetical protein